MPIQIEFLEITSSDPNISVMGLPFKIDPQLTEYSVKIYKKNVYSGIHNLFLFESRLKTKWHFFISGYRVFLRHAKELVCCFRRNYVVLILKVLKLLQTQILIAFKYIEWRAFTYTGANLSKR